MSRDKAEIISQRKTKISNGNTTNRTLSKTTKSKDDVRKMREASTDRSNLKKTAISKASTSLKKADSVSSKPKESIKSRTTTKLSTDKTVPSKTTSKPSIKVDKNTTVKTSSRTTVTKPNAKPVKALKTTSTTSPSPKTNTNVTPKGTKLSSRDILSKRVTKEQYFPKKFPFTSNVHDGENTNTKSNNTSARINENTKPTTNKAKDTSKKETDKSTTSSKKVTRERTITRTLNPSEVKVAKSQPISEPNAERPRTATLRKHSNDADVPTSYPIIEDNVEIRVKAPPSKTLKNEQNIASSSKTKESTSLQQSENEQIRDESSSKQVEQEPIRNESSSKPVEKEPIRNANSSKPVEKELVRDARSSKPVEKEPVRNESSNKPVEKEPVRNASSSKPVAHEPIRGETLNKQPVSAENESNSDNDDYEDDFDSYNSDFEVYSSSNSTASESSSIETDSRTSKSSSSSGNIIEMIQKRTNSAGNEEERKLDSGNYDLPDVKHKQMLDRIKEAIERENSDLAMVKSEVRSNLGSLSDEGFEDGSKYSLNTNGFINFADVRRKQQKLKLQSKTKRRGDELMNMIRLDSVSYNLFDANAISYDEFMQSYGRSGTVQVSAQTGDDDLDEDIQTDTIEMLNKWTQCPVRFSKNEQLNSDEQFGVGSDPPVAKTTSNAPKIDHNMMKRAAKFLNTAGNLLLHILEQKSNENNHKLILNPQIKFSEGFHTLNYETTPFLNDRSVTLLAYSKHSMLLTVHKSCLNSSVDRNEEVFCKSLICTWNLLEPLQPQSILVSSGEISKACFDIQFGYLVFGGIGDGSISVWDVREPEKFHRKIMYQKNNSVYILRSPTHNKVATRDLELCTTKIVSIQTFCTDLDVPADTRNVSNLPTIQACTLDETGVIVFWSIIQRQSTPEKVPHDQGLAPWASVSLVQGLVVSLQDLNPNFMELHCFDLQLSNEDSNHLFVSSNYGVLHCLASGMKPKPRYYASTEKCSTRCLEMAPFSAKYFLSGCENGHIKLHSRFYERPLMNLCNSQETDSPQQAVDMIEWSQCRPCVFYVKDRANFIHIWDLTVSDMCPKYSVPFSEDISDIKLSPILENPAENLSYMAIATTKGTVSVHTLTKEFCRQHQDQCQNELKLFLNYVNRL